MNWDGRAPKIALIDISRCEQVLIQAVSCLSVREALRWRQYRHEARRKEWLAGRLAVKALFWQCLKQIDVTGSVGQPKVQNLTPSMLAILPLQDLHQIEILAPGRGKAPRLFWNAAPVHGGLSIAHAGGFVCVGISQLGDLGIDIETCEPRAPAYYGSSFSESERQWVQSLDMNNRDRQTFGYTLLWSFKESLFKTGQLMHHGMIAADTISVELPSLMIALRSDWSAPSAVTMLSVLLRSSSLPRNRRVQAAYSFNGQCVITLIYLYPESTNL